MVRPTFINVNPLELKHYSFKINLNKYTTSYNVLSSKIFVPKETKEINVKEFNMITSKAEANAMAEHILCNWKCKFNSKIWNSKQKQNNKTYQCTCKNYRMCKDNYSWNPSTCICENSKYLKHIADVTVIECNVTIINNLSTKKTRTKARNFTNTALINFHSKKVRDCYILHTVLLVIILLLIITTICYH